MCRKKFLKNKTFLTMRNTRNHKGWKKNNKCKKDKNHKVQTKEKSMNNHKDKSYIRRRLYTKNKFLHW